MPRGMNFSASSQAGESANVWVLRGERSIAACGSAHRDDPCSEALAIRQRKRSAASRLQTEVLHCNTRVRLPCLARFAFKSCSKNRRESASRPWQPGRMPIGQDVGDALTGRGRGLGVSAWAHLTSSLFSWIASWHGYVWPGRLTSVLDQETLAGSEQRQRVLRRRG